MAAEQIQAVFKRLVKDGRCVWCEKEKPELFCVSIQGSSFTDAHLCRACLLRAISMQARTLGNPAQAPTGNGTPQAAGRASS
jgi:hypothetical protein